MRSENHLQQEKLTVLFLLWKTDLWLSELQIVQVLTELSVMNYFAVKGALLTLTADGLIRQNVTEDTSSYHISDEGRRTISTLQTEVRLSWRQSLESYIGTHREMLRQNSQFRAFFLEDPPGHFRTHLEIHSGGVLIFELVLAADSRRDAKRMVRRWHENAVEIYQTVLASLC